MPEEFKILVKGIAALKGYIYIYIYYWRPWCSGNCIATKSQGRRFDPHWRLIIYLINFPSISGNRIATKPRRLKSSRRQQ